MHPKALPLTSDATQVTRPLSHPVSHWAFSLFLPDATDVKPTQNLSSVFTSVASGGKPTLGSFPYDALKL